MNGHTFVGGWIDRMTSGLIDRAARGIPEDLGERLREEWFADSLLEQPGRLARLRFALGCCWAATVIQHDPVALPVAQLAAPAAGTALPVPKYRGPSFHAKRQVVSTADAAICDMNITPLIDVMLVMLVTMILTLPAMTHAVKLVLPPAQAATSTPAETIDLDIDFDGRIVWNGSAVANFQQLESYLQVAARKNPQPQIHLRPDPHVKYDLVAKVLASAQRHGMNTIGFVDTAAFID